MLLALSMFGATVFAPVTLLPVIPLVAPILGPFATGCASWLGWTGGAVIAFLIARHGGRPAITRFVSLRVLDQFESSLPVGAHFWLIVALRLAVPVDVLSYALGLFSSVKLGTYTAASALGIAWFSFAFAYLGDALVRGNAVLFGGFIVASLVILMGAFQYVRSLRIDGEHH